VAKPLVSLNRPLGLYFNLRLLVLLRAWVNLNRPLTRTIQPPLNNKRRSKHDKTQSCASGSAG